MADVFVFGTPVSVGHVRPLLPLARRLVERGIDVVWAISGDPTEPAEVWRVQLEQLGVRLVNVDDVAPFARCNADEITSGGLYLGLFRRIVARANDVASPAAGAIRAAVAGRRVVGGLCDYFAMWAYVAMRRLGIAQVDVIVSAFPAVLETLPPTYAEDPVYQRELARLRGGEVGAFGEMPRSGIVPRDPALRLLAYCSSLLCPTPTPGVQFLGVQREALPHIEGTLAPEHAALVERLRLERDRGTRIVLLSMGTVVTRMFARMSAAHVAFLSRLYSTLAASALRAGAIVVASTCDSSAADLGVDEATLGPAARERVITMPFVPQPLLFAHGLVDVMLMHGGANTLYEAVVSGIPLLVCPGFGDQESVAQAVAALGLGACVESITIPNLTGAVAIERVGAELLPAMLAPGITTWKAAATSLAARIREEDGLGAMEALLVATRANEPALGT
jgi:UDP:flavonoid glycosyltransferase YjiC (YdhE family)